MSLDLDDETRAALGWGDALETDRMPSFQRATPRPPRTPKPKPIDGRHRRNWRRKLKETRR